MKKRRDSKPKNSRTYKLIELVGTSEKNYEDAIRQAVREAGRSLDGLAWFQVTELRGGIKDGEVSEFQAILKLGFRVLGAAD